MRQLLKLKNKKKTYYKCAMVVCNQYKNSLNRSLDPILILYLIFQDLYKHKSKSELSKTKELQDKPVIKPVDSKDNKMNN